jgi:hypothetical protein
LASFSRASTLKATIMMMVRHEKRVGGHALYKKPTEYRKSPREVRL